MEQPKRGRGRPPKVDLKMPAAPVQLPDPPAAPAPAAPAGTPVDLKTAEAEPEFEITDLPLFAGTQLRGAETPTQIVVQRLGPVPEGVVGTIDPRAEEGEIKRLYGGGTYRLEAKGPRGWNLKGGVRTISIAGEPIFQSEGARVEHARLMRNHLSAAPTMHIAAPSLPAPAPAPPTQYVAAPPPSMPTPQQATGFDAASLVAMFGAILSANAQQTTAMMQAQGASTQAMMALIMEQAKSKEEANMRFFELMKQNAPAAPADPLTLIKEGMRLMSRVNGGKDGGEPDPLGKVLEAAPKLLAQGAEIVRGERALKRDQREASSAAPPAAPAGPPPPSAIQAAYEEIAARPDVMLLEGELGTMANKAIEHLTSLGVRPDIAIAQVWTTLTSVTREQAQASGLLAPQAAAPPPPPPPPPEPVGMEPVPMGRDAFEAAGA